MIVYSCDFQSALGARASLAVLALVLHAPRVVPPSHLYTRAGYERVSGPRANCDTTSGQKELYTKELHSYCTWTKRLHRLLDNRSSTCAPPNLPWRVSTHPPGSSPGLRGVFPARHCSYADRT